MYSSNYHNLWKPCRMYSTSWRSTSHLSIHPSMKQSISSVLSTELNAGDTKANKPSNRWVCAHDLCWMLYKTKPWKLCSFSSILALKVPDSIHRWLIWSNRRQQQSGLPAPAENQHLFMPQFNTSRKRKTLKKKMLSFIQAICVYDSLAISPCPWQGSFY